MATIVVGCMHRRDTLQPMLLDNLIMFTVGNCYYANTQ